MEIDNQTTACGIIFDLDGTLVDSLPGLWEMATETFIAAKLPAPSRKIVEGGIGYGIEALVRHCLAASHGDVGVDLIKSLTADLLARYKENPTRGARLYEGVHKAIHDFKLLGFKLAICTNKNEDMALSLLEKLGILADFDFVIGGKKGRVRKPDPVMVFSAIRALGLPHSQCFYIGDSQIDNETAIAARLPFLFHTKGYCHVPYSQLHFDACFDSFDKLVGQVVGLAQQSCWQDNKLQGWA